MLREWDHALADEAVNACSDSSLGARLEGIREISQPRFDLNGSHPSKPAAIKQVTLPLSSLKAAGQKRKAEAQERLQIDVDLLIVRLICTCGLVPNILDSPEWKELMHKLNAGYHATSRSVFEDKLIPAQAAWVRKKDIETLSKEDSLTLTFDGTSLRSLDGMYTVHATTPKPRESYFLDAHRDEDLDKVDHIFAYTYVNQDY